MDTKTGDIYTNEAFKKMMEMTYTGDKDSGHLKEMQVAPTKKQLKRKSIDPRAIGRVGRNEKCPCGSDKKFKYCCLNV